MNDDVKTILMFAMLAVRDFTRLNFNEFSISSIKFDDKDKEYYYITIEFRNHKTSRDWVLRK